MDDMEAKAFKPYFVMIALLVGTSVLLGTTVQVDVSNEAGVRLLDDREDELHIYLPSQVGEWKGREMRFCQNASCRKSFFADQLDSLYVCPECGGQLYSMSLDEFRLLPRDTGMVKMRYQNALNETVFVTVVLSGRERSSIHRPQRCLVGQGNSIVNTRDIDVALDDRKDLDVKLLDMVRNINLRGGRTLVEKSYYAYWFVGRDRETSSHIQRMVWMAMDRILYNKAHRWAYIGIAGLRDEGDEHLPEIKDFIRQLHPRITMNEEHTNEQS